MVFAFLTPRGPHTSAAAQSSANAGGGGGESSLHRPDPCDLLPDPPGIANGIEKQCPSSGSSSGIAKGDFNGDTFADLAVGVPDEEIGSTTDAGAVNVIYGSANGLTATNTSIPASQFWSENNTQVPGGAHAGDHFGAALASGDFNGDGLSDLAVGIPNKTVNGNSGAGGVVVIFGSSNGLSATAKAPQYFDLTSYNSNFVPDFNPTFQNAHFGQALAWGNFDGDKNNGKDVGDLAIGVPGFSWFEILVPHSNVGGLMMIRGRTSGSLQPVDILLENSRSNGIGASEESGDFFAGSLTSGDFNGDGFSDLAVGVSNKTVSGHSGAGAVHVLYGGASDGSTSGLLHGSPVQLNWSQDSSGISGAAETKDHFGSSLAAGDFNGDGKSDLAIGITGEDIGSVVNDGAVSVIYGSASLLTATGSQLWFYGQIGLTDEAGANFGRALAAGDFNGDGRADLAVGAPFKDVLGIVDAGQVNIIYGTSTRLEATGSQTWTQIRLNLADPSDMPVSSHSGDNFGAALTAWNFGHDLEIDRSGVQITTHTADLAIGAPFEAVGGVSAAGAVIVSYGSQVLNGLAISGTQLWTQSSSGVPGGAEKDDHFGAALY
jgi:FG-GAP repeat protein